MKVKWITGLVILCLVSAVLASLATLLALSSGIAGFVLASGKTSQTSTQETMAAPTPTPTLKPTATPTPAATETQETIETQSPATGYLYLLETQELITKIYDDSSQSVVNVEIEVAQTGSSVTKTNKGSGLIIRQTGEIATNAAILSIALDSQGKLLGEATIRVTVKGIDESFYASFVGQDSETGLAVIKIEPDDYTLKPAQIAKQPDLNIGQIILAVGYPDILYEEGGLTSGLITGLNRTVSLESGVEMQMIQIDAPISLTCSGGPLLDLEGKVIGLTNCQIVRQSVDSVSYAVPASTLVEVTDQLIDQASDKNPAWLGISVLSESSFLSLQKLYDLPDGLYVSSVIKDSPAYTAGLRKYDIITAINDGEVLPSVDLSDILKEQPVGALLEITVYRRSDGRYHELKAYLQERIN